MAEPDPLRRAIRDSSELSKEGQKEKAIKVLDDSLAQAIRENRTSWVRVLCHHAAVIADSMNDLGLAQHYYELSLRYGPDNPTSLYGLASVLERLGQTELAKRYASQCYQVSLRGGTDIDRGRIELIARTWPEIGEKKTKE